MSSIRNVQLELLRSGPAHNQLLSPLTPYIALCGSAGPVTVNMPFEHRQLLARLERLRYGSNSAAVSASQREGEVRDIGEHIGRVFAQVPALITELSNGSEEQANLINLRLSITAYELGLVPFEAAIGPDGVPAAGAPLVLRSLVSMTREIRRAQPMTVEWNRPPRILFAFASPQGLAPVPAQAHLTALRRAISPWVKIRDGSAERLDEVKKILTPLPDASLDKIREACRSDDYTHVHILAHGAPFEEAGVERYGLALCAEADASRAHVVDGERLAIALKGWDSSGRRRKPPTLVSLAACDSGNINEVLVPGGSIAHELHTHGIPWVIASQFPLWMRASSIAAEVLYAGLLGGNDPRWVLHELRQRLRTDVPDTHDWASIVAYAAIAPDLEAQVEAFRDSQFRRRMEVLFDRMDTLVGANEPAAIDRTPGAAAHRQEIDTLSGRIRSDLAAWLAEPAARDDPKQRAERLGMTAASEKRIAISYALAGNDTASRDAYQRARDSYRSAIEAEPANHWLLTQYLSLSAVPMLVDTGQLPSLIEEHLPWWTFARQIARWHLRHTQPTDRAWALATLAELELLGSIYMGGSFDRPRALERIGRLCGEIRELVPADSFQVFSTLRQFRRYVGHWSRDEWNDLARSAIEALEAA